MPDFGRVGTGGAGAIKAISTVTGKAATDTHQYTGSVIVADDNKLIFGANQNVSIEYDEDGTDELRFAGGAVTFEQAVTFDANVTLGDAAIDVITSTGQFTASQGAKFSNDVFLAVDDVKLYFGTGNDSSIMYGDAGGGSDEFVITLGSDGGGIQMPDNDGAALEIREAGNTYMRFNTTNGQETVSMIKSLTISDNIKINFGDGQPDCTLERDADGTDMLILIPPAAGMSIGSAFHRVSQDVSITKADSGDNDVAVELSGVKIPNDSIITRVIAVTKTLGNLNTALYNVQISSTSGTSADAAISSGTELIGAGASGTADSNGSSAADIIMSNVGNSGVVNKVWYNDTIVKTANDMYVYVCNAGTGNGTTDPAVGTMTIIIEYYGID